MRLPRILFTVVTFLTLVVAGIAHGQTQDISARRAAFERGEKAIKDKNWDDAERIYLELWDAQRSYDVGLSLGVVEINLKRYADAAAHLDFGLANVPAREKPELVERMRTLFQLAKQQVGAVSVVVNQPKAEVYLDSRLIGTSPLSAPVYVDVGPHEVHARLANDVTPDVHVDALAGQNYKVDLRLEDPPAEPRLSPLPANDRDLAPPPRADRLPSSRNYTPAIVAASVGGVALVGGVASLIVSVDKHNDAQHRLAALGDSDACGPGMSPDHAAECRTISNQADGSHTFRTLSFVGFGTAVAAGAVTYLLWPKSAARSLALNARVGVSRESFMAAVGGKF